MLARASVPRFIGFVAELMRNCIYVYIYISRVSFLETHDPEEEGEEEKRIRVRER